MILDDINHDALFSGSSLEIGKIHWYIQKADTEMNRRCWVKGEKFFDHKELTDFGKEVIDEIHWWIFKKETEIEELYEKTKNTLSAVQKLKEDSSLLKEKYYVESYLELVQRIKEFTEAHKEDIHILYEYVVWLNEEDVLAPSMLFTYRVWGSTRLSDRTVIIPVNGIDEDLERIKICTEVALGLRDTSRYTLEHVYFDICSDLADSIDPEFHSSISVSDEDVLVRTSYKIRNELAEYFEFIRQSLRNILIDIEKYNAQTNLLYHESFWQSFIKKAVEIKIENQLWDFKETFEMWHMKNREKEDAEIKFCEQIAAFANERGGVLVVGITNGIPREFKGIEDLENKLKFTKFTIKRYINYANDFVHFQHIALEDDAGIDKNCLIIAIAQTKDVISVKDNSGRFSYPVRSETGLDRADYEKIKKSKMFVQYDNYAFILNLPVK